MFEAMFETIGMLSGRAALVGLVVLFITQATFRRPTVSIAAAILAGLASLAF